ncbi:hypothetical protein CYY_009448 [Polysphondylium violaceum]|uniref:WD40 repeat-containing protein n=1 Tax=Polysphondylium violaceum TaxID=133409 RepID=A0A8J4PMU0_9MYCE|nr:hypothetical protein CYY_009448 [Polysphondylium violaceum]
MPWGTNYFAAGTADNFIHIYDLKRSFYYSKKLTGHVFQTKGLALCTQLNDKYLYSASLDKQSILWNVEKGFIVSVFPLGSPTSSFTKTTTMISLLSYQNILVKSII